MPCAHPALFMVPPVGCLLLPKKPVETERDTTENPMGMQREQAAARSRFQPEQNAVPAETRSSLGVMAQAPLAHPGPEGA